MYRDFQTKLEDILQSSKLEFSSEDIGADGKLYQINTHELTCTIKLTRDWIGYDLTVHKTVLGRSIGDSVDTDNYSLAHDPTITREIAEKIFVCTKAIAGKKIYAGHSGNDLLLAIPTPNHKYKLKTFSPRTKWWKLDSSTTELIEQRDMQKLLPNLKILS